VVFSVVWCDVLCDKMHDYVAPEEIGSSLFHNFMHKFKELVNKTVTKGTFSYTLG
jgi:hypothetical protein